MGYTHYWKLKGSKVSNVQWEVFCSAVRKLLAHPDCPPVLRESDEPDSKPEVTRDLVRFNGRGGDGHETFFLSREGAAFEVCKTARKPYDKLVVAVLIAAKWTFGPAIEISSDGDWSEDDWVAGALFFERTLNRRAVNPLQEAV